jgi:hypothetical protein
MSSSTNLSLTGVSEETAVTVAKARNAEFKAGVEKRREERTEAARRQSKHEEDAEQRRLERNRGGAAAAPIRTFERPLERSSESASDPSKLNLISEKLTWCEREAAMRNQQATIQSQTAAEIAKQVGKEVTENVTAALETTLLELQKPTFDVREQILGMC